MKDKRKKDKIEKNESQTKINDEKPDFNIDEILLKILESRK